MSDEPKTIEQLEAEIAALKQEQDAAPDTPAEPEASAESEQPPADNPDAAALQSAEGQMPAEVVAELNQEVQQGEAAQPDEPQPDPAPEPAAPTEAVVVPPELPDGHPLSYLGGEYRTLAAYIARLEAKVGVP